MKVTIIKDDGAVYKDGVSYSDLVLNSIPNDVHALQWNNNAGHIEYVNNYKPVADILELPDWANDCLFAWEKAWEKAEAERVALVAKQVDALPATL